MAARINYVQGDATAPEPREGFIVHICNDIGGWGSGFVLALTARWPQPETQYRQWARDGVSNMGRPFELGEVSYVTVEPGLHVVNMIAQHNTGIAPDGTPPIRYDALATCLRRVALKADDLGKIPVHMPRIGCGLAGGDWDEVSKIIDKTLCVLDIPVMVYDL